MSGFDNRRTLSYVADAPSFSAVITPGTAVQTAVITCKPTFKVGVPSVTTTTMDQLMAALLRLDAGCKFYKRGEHVGTLSAKDAAALEALRTDPKVTDIQYRSACRNFGVKPQVRNLQTATTNTSAPQSAPTLSDSVVAWGKFETEHNELFASVFAAANLKAIEQWFGDEPGAQWNAANLATCYRELKALNVFRTANVLTRGMHGDLQVVQPYSRERILALRSQQAIDVATAPLAYLSDVEKDCWLAVRQAHPKLAVGSPAFQTCCKDTLLKWSREYALEQDPSLGAANKRGELRAAIDRVITQWVRIKNPNLGAGNKTIKDTRIWLG
jgi:hypothetical protein